jgi:hypothetical protein
LLTCHARLYSFCCRSSFDTPVMGGEVPRVIESHFQVVVTAGRRWDSS